MRLRTRIGGAVVLCCVAALVLIPHAAVAKWIHAVKGTVLGAPGHSTVAVVPGKPAPLLPRKLKVMAVGGSSAQGYYDPKKDGYLTRALRTVSSTLNIPITFVNKAKSGDIPTMLAPRYDPLVHAIHPDVVILSWGLLDSIAKKVPQEMFRRVIETEVSQALDEGADVWLVTPPATPATYGGPQMKLEPVFTHLEIQAARSVHSSHVHVFDLLGVMKQYLKDHHQSYKPYSYNQWHLNQKGHVLAGQLLADEILKNANSIGLIR